MYKRQRSPQQIEALAEWGFDGSEFEKQFDVWPENHESFELFESMSTQWRIGMSGPTGLDYTSLMNVMTLRDFSKERQRELFDDIRVMESAALNEMHRTKD